VIFTPSLHRIELEIECDIGEYVYWRDRILASETGFQTHSQFQCSKKLLKNEFLQTNRSVLSFSYLASMVWKMSCWGVWKMSCWGLWVCALGRALSKLPFQLGPLVHGRLQNLQTSDDTFGHVLTPLKDVSQNHARLQVTVFGESAGASSASILSLSPYSEGLFHRIILQSGSAFAIGSFDRSNQEIADMNSRLKVHANCTQRSIYECFRDMSIEDLFRITQDFPKDAVFHPTFDEDLLHDSSFAYELSKR